MRTRSFLAVCSLPLLAGCFAGRFILDGPTTFFAVMNTVDAVAAHKKNANSQTVVDGNYKDGFWFDRDLFFVQVISDSTEESKRVAHDTATNSCAQQGKALKVVETDDRLAWPAIKATRFPYWLKFRCEINSVYAQTDPIPICSATVETSTALAPGDRLTFRDTDLISGVKIAEFTWVVDSATSERVSFNGGTIVMAADGTPIKPPDSVIHVYGYSRCGASSSAKFRVPGINKDQVMELSARGPETIRVAGREFNGIRYIIDGFASTITPGRPYLGAGASVSGEMLIDGSTGIVLRLKTSSRHPSYDVHRNLVDIAR